ncbi:MAG: class I SAM-dependent methyltransferase [Flavobacteriaceae bacterium]|nr:class I SAM-dependent methyltransferase [Flavobacteriaceae bacterium]
MKRILVRLQYLWYWIKASNAHGLHSPYVFDFYNRVLHPKSKKDTFHSIENLRKSLLQNHQIVQVTDWGASSSQTKTSGKRISTLAKFAAKPEKYARLLSRIADFCEAKVVLELGTSLGISSMYLASDKKRLVYTVEGCPNIAALSQTHFRQLGYKNLRGHIGLFDAVLPKILSETRPDLIFIDGDHRREATLHYFDMCLAKVSSKTVFIFDDINWSTGMKAAWKEIQKHPKVTVSVDLFFMGIVFLNEELSKQHFVLRY